MKKIIAAILMLITILSHAQKKDSSSIFTYRGHQATILFNKDGSYGGFQMSGQRFESMEDQISFSKAFDAHFDSLNIPHIGAVKKKPKHQHYNHVHKNNPLKSKIDDQGSSFAQTSINLYENERQDTIPCTMVVGNLTATDGIKCIGNNPADSSCYYFANVFTIKGYMVVPQSASPFYLDEQKRIMPFLHVWMAYPYNYHDPIRSLVK